MELVLCIGISAIVSAVVSILMLKFFAYKYFDVIDKYVNEVMDGVKEVFHLSQNQ